MYLYNTPVRSDIPLNDIKRIISDQAPLDVVKIVFGGEGRHGKTSTCRTLMEKPFTVDSESTRGIDIQNAIINGNVRS